MLRRIILTGVLLSLVSVNAQAEDINVIFKKVNDLITSKNYSKALEELGWAEKEIQKLHTQQIQTFFPDSLAGFTGQKIEANSAMGMTNIQRDYTNGAEKVRLSLVGGSSNQAGLGGLAAFGKMAAMMGGQGQNSFRIDGRTATLNSESGNGQLIVFLDSGSMLQFELEKGQSADVLKTMAEAMKIGDLDNYLKGQS